MTASRSTWSSSSATGRCAWPHGFARRPPTAAEQAAMERMMDEAMADGAYGLAPPDLRAGSYAATEEIIGIARRAAGAAASTRATSAARARLARRGGRGIRVGRRAGCPPSEPRQGGGRPNWGKVADALALIAAARSEGLDVMATCTPTRVQHRCARSCPTGCSRRHRRDGEAPGRPLVCRAGPPRADGRRRDAAAGTRVVGHHGVVLAVTPGRPGRRIAEIAAAWKRDPLEPSST